MTDLTDFLTEDREAYQNAHSEGALQGQSILKQDQQVKDDKVKANGRAAYDATDLGTSGPPEGEYNYDADYQDGNTLTPDEGGGVTLNNKKFNPGVSSVAGVDVGTGKRYTDHWKDEDGDIEKGRKTLSEGQFNTLTGATYDQTDGLFDVANGMMKEKATFKQFQDEVRGPWNNDQMAMAWHAAQTAHETMEDIDTQGRRYYDEMRENYDQFEGVVQVIPVDGYTEETLAADENWIKGSRRMAEFLFGEGSTANTSDEEIARNAKFFISQTRNNLDMTILWANRIIKEDNPELARTWLALDAQYDAMDMSLDSVGRFAIAQVNITNLVTFGGGILISNLGKFATGQGIKNAIKAVAYGTAYDAALSGAAGASENLARQNIEITGEQRDEIDPLEASVMGVLNAGAGVVIGGTVNAATNKTVRQYATGKAKDAVNFMGQNMQDMGMPGHSPGSPASQRGSFSLEPTVTKGDDQVRASFKLQELLGGVKDGTKAITVQQQVKAALNKGLITPQEVKWSGIEDYLDMVDVNEVKLSRAEMLGVIENNTPRPELIPSQNPQYAEYSLKAKNAQMIGPDDAWRDTDSVINEQLLGEGYRENMIVLPGKRDPDSSYMPGHFYDAQKRQLNADDAMIGHSRVEGASTKELGNGKMVLEIQADLHRTGQQSGYATKDEWVGSQPIRKQSTENYPAGQGAHLTSSNEVYSEILGLANEHDIDPYAKNSISKLWPYLSEERRAMLSRGRPDPAPYGKDWDSLGMRLEIMDSINRGDEFIAWPSSDDQIRAIEQWGDMYEGDGSAGIVKRATVDRNKAMKKMGFEIEQVDMPQYKDALHGSNIYDMELTAADVVDNPTIRAEMNEVMTQVDTHFTAVLDDGQKVYLSNDHMVGLVNYEYGDIMVDLENAKFTVSTDEGYQSFTGIEKARDYMYEIYEKARITHGEMLSNNIPDHAIDEMADEVHEVLRRQNMLMELDWREGYSPDDWVILSYPEGIPEGLSAPELRARGEIIEVIPDAEYWNRVSDIVGDSHGVNKKKTSTMFNVIRLTDEVKTRFRKEGMKMYGAAPAAGAAASGAVKEKTGRKRDKNGRFVK